MIIQCSDLERALRTPELMPDARAHAEKCERCRRELYLWSEISRLAPQLHQDWESPALWGRIRADLAAQPPQRRVVPWWQWSLAAAAVAVLAIVLARPWVPAHPPSRELLTENALRDAEQAEAAYARAIDRLSAVAAPELQKSVSPLAAAYRDKLLLLDSEIAELKAQAQNNRYNTFLQTELASLYREKQKTLQEWLNHAKNN